MRAAIDAGALIDGSPWTAYQKLLTALAAMAIIIDGFDIQILGFAIPSLMRDWHVARSAFAPILALGLAGMSVGGPIAGYCGDRFGRRGALIGSVLLFGAATAATAFADSVGTLAVLRFITGLGVGGAVPNAGTLAAEYTPVVRRAVAVKATLLCVSLGGMLGGVVASLVLPSYGWRALYMVGGVTPLVYGLILYRILPESPRFLAQHPWGWVALARFLNRAGHAVPLDSVFEDRRERQVAERRPLRVLFDREHAGDTTGLWIAFFFCLGGIYLVFGWLPAMLTAQGLDVGAASQALAVYNFGGVVTVLIFTLLTTFLGSRGPLVVGSFAAGVIAVAILFVPVGSPGDRRYLMAALALQGGLANAVQTSMYALAAHVYPTQVRASGVGFCATIGRVGGIGSSLFGAAIIGAGAAAYWGGMAGAMVCACVGLALVRRHIPAAKAVL